MTGCEDGLRIRNSDSGIVVGTLMLKGAPTFLDLAFNPAGDHLLSIDEGGTVTAWDWDIRAVLSGRDLRKRILLQAFSAAVKGP